MEPGPDWPNGCSSPGGWTLTPGCHFLRLSPPRLLNQQDPQRFPSALDAPGAQPEPAACRPPPPHPWPLQVWNNLICSVLQTHSYSSFYTQRSPPGRGCPPRPHCSVGSTSIPALPTWHCLVGRWPPPRTAHSLKAQGMFCHLPAAAGPGPGPRAPETLEVLGACRLDGRKTG